MITREIFDSIFPTKGLNPQKFNLVRLRDELIDALNEFLPKYNISTALRVRAFLSCCGFETDQMRTTREYASGAAYEGRHDLGNYLAGDGTRYPGSSLIQTTGRYNFWRVVCRFVKKLTGKDFSKDEHRYENFGEYLKSPEYTALLAEADRLGVNFLAHPEKLREVRTAVEAACIFWEENNLNAYADRKEIKELNGIVNRGDARKTALGWADRNQLYSLCTRRIPKDFSFTQTTLPAATQSEGDDASSGGNSSPVVLTPTNDDNSQAATASGLSVKVIAQKYLAHCQDDTVKNILFVVFARISALATGLWLKGLHGKVLCVAIAFAAIIPVVYALVKYKSRLVGWFTDITDVFINQE